MYLSRAALVTLVGGIAISYELLFLAGVSLSGLSQISVGSIPSLLPVIISNLGLNLGTTILGISVFLTLAGIFREIVYDKPLPELKIAPLATDVDADVKTAPKPTKKICLVTGAAGFAGKILVEEILATGNYDLIKALDLVAPTFNDPRVINIKGNILDQSLLLKEFTDVEAVFHVASLISLRASPAIFHRLRAVNVLGCRNVVDACIRRGVKRMIYTSSTAVVFDGKKAVFSSEEEAARQNRTPNSSYGLTKREGEGLVLKANGLGQLKTIALRPYMVYGEGDNFVVKKLLSGIPPIDSSLPMSTTYVRNLAEWEILADKGLLERPEITSGRAYFVADDNDESYGRAAFNDFLIDSLKLKPQALIPVPVFRILCSIIPIVEWYTNGKYQGDVWELNEATFTFSLQHAHFAIDKGIKHLGYQTKHPKEKVTQNLRKFYNIQ